MATSEGTTEIINGVEVIFSPAKAIPPKVEGGWQFEMTVSLPDGRSQVCGIGGPKVPAAEEVEPFLRERLRAWADILSRLSDPAGKPEATLTDAELALSLSRVSAELDSRGCDHTGKRIGRPRGEKQPAS